MITYLALLVVEELFLEIPDRLGARNGLTLARISRSRRADAQCAQYCMRATSDRHAMLVLGDQMQAPNQTRTNATP